MRRSLTGTALSVLAMAMLLTACANGDGDTSNGAGAEPGGQNASDSNSADTDSEDQSGEQAEGDGYAFGVDKAAMATAIEKAFSSKNGKATWEDESTLVLSIDGDAESGMAGFTQCRVLLELLNDDDVSYIEFPNGRLACAEVLAD